jgi:hypothetical protein
VRSFPTHSTASDFTTIYYSLTRLPGLYSIPGFTPSRPISEPFPSDQTRVTVSPTPPHVSSILFASSSVSTTTSQHPRLSKISLTAEIR